MQEFFAAMCLTEPSQDLLQVDLSSGRRRQVEIVQCDTAFVESDHTTDN